MKMKVCRFCKARWTPGTLDCPECLDRKPLTRARAKLNHEAIDQGNMDLLRLVGKLENRLKAMSRGSDG